MMKTLPIDQIKWNDSFVEENEDLIPELLIWFNSIIKHGIKKENRVKYPNCWFLFDKDGTFLLEYNELDEQV